MRLAKLADEWLALEKGRKPFEVVAGRAGRELQLAGLQFTARIDRMDRLLEGEGGHVLIDYKTGYRVTPKDWEAPRPDDPQLPLYAGARRKRSPRWRSQAAARRDALYRVLAQRKSFPK